MFCFNIKFDFVKIKELRESYEQQQDQASGGASNDANSVANTSSNELEELSCIVNLNKQDYETYKSKEFVI